jgi:hypothetical protein
MNLKTLKDKTKQLEELQRHEGPEHWEAIKQPLQKSQIFLGNFSDVLGLWTHQKCF